MLQTYIEKTLQTDRKKKIQGVEKCYIQTDREKKCRGQKKCYRQTDREKMQGVQMFVCWTYFYSPKYGHRKVEEGKRKEQNGVALDSLVP